MIRQAYVRSIPGLVGRQIRLASSSSVAYNIPPKLDDFGAYSRQQAESRVVIPEDVAKQSPLVTTLHSRLGLGTNFQHSTLARTLVCTSSQTKFADNHGMATFGKNLIQFYVHEYFTIKYPRLPPQVLKHVISMYSSVKALGKIGEQWGVEEDSRPPLARYLADEKDEDLIGKLLYSSKQLQKEDGVVELIEDGNRTDRNAAMASFVRALVSGIYAHNGLETAQKFIQDYIIKPNRIDMASLLRFEQPTRELAVLCARQGMHAPVSRLMMETGRFSKSPVYIVGVFSGESKLGEGQGISIKEARTRAAVHALKSWYLYSPIDAKLPSQQGTDQYVDPGVVIM